jgi:hypothetical protein
MSMIRIEYGEYIVLHAVRAQAKGVTENRIREKLDPVQFDGGLVVVGPCHSSAVVVEQCVSWGLSYPDDFFDVNECGGSFPLWCLFSVGLRRE